MPAGSVKIGFLDIELHFSLHDRPFPFFQLCILLQDLRSVLTILPIIGFAIVVELDQIALLRVYLFFILANFIQELLDGMSGKIREQ